MIAFFLKYKSLIAGALIVVLALVIWGLSAKVGSARLEARQATEALADIQSQLHEIEADQRRSDAIVAAKLESDRVQAEKLAGLQSKLNGVMQSDKTANEWGNSVIPGALLDGLRGKGSDSSNP